MSILRVTVKDKKIQAYLSYRKGFIKSKYRTSFVDINSYSDEEFSQLEKTLTANGATYDIFSDARSMIKKFTWSKGMSYGIRNSNLYVFRKQLDKFIEDTSGHNFIIYKNYKLNTVDSTLIGIEISFLTNMSDETTREWWDLFFLGKLNKFLKSKHNVSKKSAI